MRAEKHGIFVHLLARGLPHRYAEPPPGGGLGYVPAVHLDYDDFEGVLCPYSVLALSASLSTACPLRHAYSAPPPPEGEAFQGSPSGTAPAKQVRGPYGFKVLIKESYHF